MERRKKRTSIKSRIALTVISLIIGTILIIVGAVYYNVNNSFKQQVWEDMLVMTSEVAKAIDNSIAVEEAIVQELANNVILTDSNFSLEKKIRFYGNRAEDLGYIHFLSVDAQGKGRILSDSGEEFSLADKEYFTKSIQGQVFTSSIEKSLLGDDKVVYISAPIYKNGQIVGVLVGIKDPAFLSEVCSEFKWKESGILALYDMDSNLIGHTRQELVRKGLNIYEKAASDSSYSSVGDFFREQILNKDSGVGEYLFLGDQKLAAFSNIKARGYTVLSSINQNVVFEPLRNLVITVIVISAGILLLSLFLVYFVFARSMASMFVNIKSDVEELANYNLRYTPKKDYSKRTDEIGDIFNATIKMRDNLLDIVSGITSLSQSTAATAEELTATAQSTTETSNEISDAVSNIAEGASSQAADTLNASSRVEEASAILVGMLEKIELLDSKVKSIHVKKDEGKNAISDIVRIVSENDKQTIKVNDVIIATNESAERISNASEMIQSISDQTNLLALNAAIEAARVGDAGRGFAVVADEIRKLAEDSAVFSTEISNIIVDLKSKTGNAVNLMTDVRKTILVQNEKADFASEKFNDIEDVLNQASDFVNEITKSSKKVEEGNVEMVDIIHRLSAVAEENAATSEQVSASVYSQAASIEDISKASENLAEIATNLQAEISEFKI